MALAIGKSSIRCGPVTLHTETAIHIAQQLTQVLAEYINLSQVNSQGASVLCIFVINLFCAAF